MKVNHLQGFNSTLCVVDTHGLVVGRLECCCSIRVCCRCFVSIRRMRSVGGIATEAQEKQRHQQQTCRRRNCSSPRPSYNGVGRAPFHCRGSRLHPSPPAGLKWPAVHNGLLLDSSDVKTFCVGPAVGSLYIYICLFFFCNRSNICIYPRWGKIDCPARYETGQEKRLKMTERPFPAIASL